MYQYEYPHPAVTTDCVIFSIRDERLHVLLIERGHEPYAGCWAFPGGFIDIGEDLSAAARRELREETGIECERLEQFYAFGAPERDPRERIISIAFVGIVAAANSSPAAGDDAADARWFDVAALPELAFDHREMFTRARESLLQRLTPAYLAGIILPVEFTAAELAHSYSIMHGRSLSDGEIVATHTARGLIAVAGQRPSADGPIKIYRAAGSA
jgi:8-oxo-dGTP diphosphatase